MPGTIHAEKHFTASESVRDVVIGMADGLTVPFALAAGLSGAVSSTGVIVIAGLAEIAAGSIAMGLGGYLAAFVEAYAGIRNGSTSQDLQYARVKIGTQEQQAQYGGLNFGEIYSDFD